MAIGSNDAIDKFGTQDTVSAGGGTSAVTNTSFSASSDAATWTNDDDAGDAEVTLTFQYPSGTIADYIALYMRTLNVDGTNDDPQPDSGYKHRYVGTFNMDANQAATTDQAYTITIPLPNTKTSQEYEFYVENQSDVTMTAGWTLKVTPKSVGPHA
jgi:hypothetical protein